MPDTRLYFLPYTYRLEGIRSGRRNHDVHAFLDEIPVRIPLLSSSEVPIGVTVRHADGKSFSQRAFNGRPVDTFDNLKQEYFGHPAPVTPDSFAASVEVLKDPNAFRMWKDYPLPFAEHYLDRAEQKIPAVVRQAGAMREITADRHDEDRDKAAAAAAGLVFVDGILHKEVPELHWQLRLTGDRQPRLAVTSDADSFAHKGRHAFRLDRLQEATTFSRYLGERSGHPVAVEDTVEDTGAIFWRLDDTSMAMSDTATWVMSAMANSMADQMRWMPRDFFQPFCDLRDAWNAGMPDSLAFATTLAALRASLAGGVSPRGQSLARAITEILEPALWRHENIDRLTEPDLAATDDGQAIAASFR